VAPKLTCTSDPTRSYALYLPLSYDPARPAPVLYLMDARGRALAALERFREGAERFGTVLASSYDSASDRQVDPNSQALAAMWRDTHQRLRLDDGRVYLGGFSGTARAAIEMALAERGKIAGVIAAGAGFPSGSAPEAGLPFVLFGTAGDEDFNYDEMLQLDETLDRLGIVHRIEVFRGGHDWMPARLASRALAWMELQAMAAAKRNREASLISSLWTEALGEARSLEQEGRPSEAARLYRATAADFRGLLDVAEASEPALRLAGSERVRRERREDENLRRRERQVLSEAWRLLGAASSSSSVSSDPARLPAALRLDEWKRKSRGKDPRLAASARRILNALLVQTAYYLPEEASRRKDDRAVILCLTVAAAIRPEDPELLYRLAAARARAGDSREALRSLERAVQRGFADLERLRQDDDFKRLRGDRAYRRLEAEVEGRRGVRPPAS
jgi:predicted esterase